MFESRRSLVRGVLGVSVLVVTVMLSSSSALADFQQDSVDAQVAVNSIFGFTIADTSTIDFGAGDPGDFLNASHSISLDCQSNNNLPWRIDLAANPLEKGATGATIPNTNFVFWHAKDNGANPEDPQGALLPSGFGFDNRSPMVGGAGQTVYTSGAGEGVDNLIQVIFDFQVEVPADPPQEAGPYSTTVFVTMTE